MRGSNASLVILLAAAVSSGGCRNEKSGAPAVPTATVAATAESPRANSPDRADETATETADEVIVWANAEPDAGAPPLSVQFTVESLEEGFDNPTYEWEFGDGSPTSKEASPTHTYSKPGTYTATVTVREADGRLGRDETWVEVQAAERD